MTGQLFTFLETGWRDNRTTAYFKYEIKTDEKTFQLEEVLQFPREIPETYESAALIRALHLALGISYYKSFIPPEIHHNYHMSEVEADFWNTTYINGLGEFMYVNELELDQIARFKQQDGEKIDFTHQTNFKDNALLGIGGGKDSIVAGELLKKIDIPVEGFVLSTKNKVGQTREVADTMNINLTQVKRHLDPQILEINKLSGALNGHIPISLIFALVGSLLALERRAKYIVVANEASSSIPQVTLGNLPINHQWSKSVEFERLFQDYLRAYVSKELSYFSAIRPLTSVAIAKIFSKYPEYFEVFTSDNSVFKLTDQERTHPRWSRDSSKTLSSYILFSAWLSEDKLESIFGYDYLRDVAMKQRVIDLLGGGTPVLDCVGTPAELQASLKSAISQNKFQNSELLTDETILNLVNSSKDIDSFLQPDSDAFPPDLDKKLKDAIELMV